jgi:hypothetical protein
VSHWHILVNTFFWVCAFHLGTLQAQLVRLISFLPTLPEPTALPPLRAASAHPVPQSSKPQDTASAPLLVTLISPLKSLLKPSRSSMTLIAFKLTIAAGHRLPYRPSGPIKGGDPHCYSPHLRAQALQPPSSIAATASSPSPGHHTTARAPVRPEMGSLRSSLSFVPSPMTSHAPEWPEAMLS